MTEYSQLGEIPETAAFSDMLRLKKGNDIQLNTAIKT